MSQLHMYQGDFQTRRLIVGDVVTSGTANRETDVVGALTRGIAEYLMQCELHNWSDGQAHAFRSAHDQAPESHDDRADMPAFVVTVGAVDFESGMSGGIVSAATLPSPNDGPFLDGVEISASLSIRVSCRSKSERAALLALVQDALTIEPGSMSVRLLLPYYHGSYAIYSLLRLENFTDGAEKKIWQADVVLQASGQFWRVYTPGAAPPAQVFTSLIVSYEESTFPIVRSLSPPTHGVVILGRGAGAE